MTKHLLPQAKLWAYYVENGTLIGNLDKTDKTDKPRENDPMYPALKIVL